MHYNIKVYSTDILYRFIIVITIILLAKEILTGQCPCTGVLCFSLTVLTACSCCFFFYVIFHVAGEVTCHVAGWATTL